MLIFAHHRDGSIMTIRRDSNFDIQSWANQNANNFKLLGVTHIEYEII